MLVERSVRGRARRPVDADAVTPRQGGLSGVAILVLREGHRVECECTLPDWERRITWQPAIIGGFASVVRVIAPQGDPVFLGEDFAFPSHWILGVYQCLVGDVARRANRAPDGPSWDRRLVEAVAAETDDGSLSVAVGDSVDTTDVEFRRQLNGDSEFIARECH